MQGSSSSDQVLLDLTFSIEYSHQRSLRVLEYTYSRLPFNTLPTVLRQFGK